MAKILALKSSVLGDYSQSSKLIDQFLATQDADVTVRDLAANPVPVLDGELVGMLRPAGELSARQQEAKILSDTLIKEVKEADLLVVGAPMYNFAIPTQLKTWFDFVARAGETFSYTETGPVGLITNTKALIVSTRGGLHKDGGSDFEVPYLKTLLGFLGISDIEVVYAEGLAMGDEMAKTQLDNAASQLANYSL
ncbi:FMN-dependent NADH-azoreductase [Celerinatantimonas yamalensis]|uniref:FMN dependent NADH:quinone oxidoreductase n=1 Tax=Celerinatantimonas yamalensis TaxID=559956 RepID=A0ABW9GAT8_9GAMM